ncbi:MAG: hypothetical protein IRZ03_17595 [Acidobacterium ailaaui]|nr:hypothetical protein [Pseudacidobacterium ailaaui]
MKDYSSYHQINVRDKLISDGNYLFQQALNGLSGVDVTVNGINKRLILSPKFSTDERNIMKVIAKHGDISIGDIVVYNDQNWLIYTFPDSTMVYDKAYMELCNQTLTFQGEPTRTQTGTTPWGEPIYNETPGQTFTYPCIVKSIRDLYDSNSSNEQINIANSKIALMIKNDNNDQLKENVEFDMFGNHYRIYGFDRSKTLNDKGLLIVLADKY